MTETQNCMLHQAVGRTLRCPGSPCPFWESGSRGEGCGFERLGLRIDDPRVAQPFLDEWTLALLQRSGESAAADAA